MSSESNLPEPEQVPVDMSFLAEKLTTYIYTQDREQKDISHTKFVLCLIGTGALASDPIHIEPFAIPNSFFHTYYRNNGARLIHKRFSISYLKRTLERLQAQKCIELSEHEGKQIARITEKGARKILQYAISELQVPKTPMWDGMWWLVIYDLPTERSKYRDIIRNYFKTWGFYPVQRSVYIHAYPCSDQVKFIRDYYGLGEHIKIYRVNQAEDADKLKAHFKV